MCIWPQAGILSNAPGAVKSMLLLGVLPRSVGIKLASGAMFVVGAKAKRSSHASTASFSDAICDQNHPGTVAVHR